MRARDRERLQRLLALTASNHDGEALAALRKASAMLAAGGDTIADLVAAIPVAPEPAPPPQPPQAPSWRFTTTSGFATATNTSANSWSTGWPGAIRDPGLVQAAAAMLNGLRGRRVRIAHIDRLREIERRIETGGAFYQADVDFLREVEMGAI